MPHIEVIQSFIQENFNLHSPPKSIQKKNNQQQQKRAEYISTIPSFLTLSFPVTFAVIVDTAIIIGPLLTISR